MGRVLSPYVNPDIMEYIAVRRETLCHFQLEFEYYVQNMASKIVMSVGRSKKIRI